MHITFDKLVERSREQIFALAAEHVNLSRIMDALLPKLLSGGLNLDINKKELVNG